MALFKSYHGLEAELEKVAIQNGNIYYVTDEGKERAFVDIDDRRIELGSAWAQKLRKFDANGEVYNEIELDEIQLRSDIASIKQGGTGGATEEEARENLNVFSKEEIATVSYPVTLIVENWVAAEDVFTYNYENTAITCGTNGEVSPIIAGVSNIAEYSYITAAEATPEVGIVFTCSKQPTSNIEIIVVDVK